MVLQEEEKIDLDLICSICRCDKATVQEVLRAVLQAMTIRVYAEKGELIIPYICKLSLDYNDRATSRGIVTDVTLEATPMKSLIQEVSAISEGVEPPSKKKFKESMKDGFNLILDKDKK